MGAAASGAMDSPRRFATLFWLAVTALGIVGGIVLLLLSEWLWGVSIIVAGCVVHVANLKSATQFVAEKAKEDRSFFHAAIATGLIVKKNMLT